MTPPVYTGKPPVILSAANKDAAAPDAGPLPVPAGSTLIVRSSGGSLDVVVGGGLTEAAPAEQAPKGTNEKHFTIAADGTAHVRAPSGQPQWKFSAVARPCADHCAGERSRAAGARLAADVLQAGGRLRRHRSAGAFRRASRRSREGRRGPAAVRSAEIRAGAAERAHPQRRRPDRQGSQRRPLRRRRRDVDADGKRRSRQ